MQAELNVIGIPLEEIRRQFGTNDRQDIKIVVDSVFSGEERSRDVIWTHSPETRANRVYAAEDLRAAPIVPGFRGPLEASLCSPGARQDFHVHPNHWEVYFTNESIKAVYRLPGEAENRILLLEQGGVIVIGPGVGHRITCQGLTFVLEQPSNHGDKVELDEVLSTPPSFSCADGIGVWFFKLALESRNKKMREQIQARADAKAGITLVARMPLPRDLRDSIRELQHEFDALLRKYAPNVGARWRSEDESFHMTIYGVTKPADYTPGMTIAKTGLCEPIRRISRGRLGFSLTVSGLNVMGNGQIALRISDSRGLDELRKEIAEIPGASEFSPGEGFNKSVIGQIIPELSEHERDQLKAIVEQLRDRRIGEIPIRKDELSLVRFRNEELTELDEHIDVLTGESYS